MDNPEFPEGVEMADGMPSSIEMTNADVQTAVAELTAKLQAAIQNI